MVVLRRWIFRLGLAATLAAGIGYLPYRASGGISRALRLKGQLAEIVEENSQLEQENRRLRGHIARLTADRHAMERVARDELGLVQADDLVFQLERAPLAAAPGAASRQAARK